MSYTVLARKWRPQTFDDLTGQETFVRTIKNAVAQQKVVHAYLFSGPRGVGKTSAARILAKALNCSQGPTTEPCGACQNCKAITDGSYVDVFEIDGASNNSVDDVRELRESVKYAPSHGKYKIYIIDEVHMLSQSAFNALLKTLEEPPSHVIFVFATTEPKKVPSTILSRCQHHAFRKIPKTKIKERLLNISKAENITIRETAIEMIARTADGSMRDALTILDQASSFSDDISENELQILLGLPETGVILKLSDTILSGDISETLAIIKEITERGYDLRPIIKELVEHFRNIAIVKIVKKPDEFLDFTGEEVNNLQRQASLMTAEELTLLLTELLRLESEVRSAGNPRYSLELGLLRTSFIKGMTSINELLKKLDTAESHGMSSPNRTGDMHHKKKSLTDVQSKPEVSDKITLWSDVIERLKSQDSLLVCKLAEAKVMDMTKQELVIGFNGGMSVLSDSVKKSAPLIEAVVHDITGNKMRLKIVSFSEEGKKINGVKDEVFSDPVVKNVMELFNGKLLEVKSLKGEEHA